MAAALVAMQHRHQHERSCCPTRRRTAQHLPLNLSPIGAQDKVYYKPEEIIHAIANDKQKALYCSDKPILATWPSHISIITTTQ
jgi:hypothetical protein